MNLPETVLLAARFCCFLWLISLSPVSAQQNPPKVRREFRAVWVATVANIDFPSSPNLTTARQKAEIVKILDLARDLRFNVIVFQIRPHADALYSSKIEPWSEYLTGEQGRAPQPFYDPLKFAIDEAHRRGILVHAWFNPYRAGHPAAKSPLAPTHIARRRPDLVKKYGRYLWLDPGEKEVQNYSLRVISDVVRRYDLDGVHFDDYFYPYPERGADGGNISFPDDASFQKYLKSGGKLSRDDWRRKNVDDFIRATALEIKRIKPNVLFGVSPFGIWKPIPEKGIKGFNAYEELYADARKWLQSGWVDYLAPQLYWSSQREGVRFPVLLDWWKAQNQKNRHLWFGVASYRINSSADFTAQEIADQIETTRRTLGASAGTIHFSMKPILQDKGGIAKLLRDKIYAEDALIPATPWLRAAKLAPPIVRASSGYATWRASRKENIFRWIVYTQDENGWQTIILPAGETGRRLPTGVKRIAVAAVDRLGNESVPVTKTLK